MRTRLSPPVAVRADGAGLREEGSGEQSATAECALPPSGSGASASEPSRAAQPRRSAQRRQEARKVVAAGEEGAECQAQRQAHACHERSAMPRTRQRLRRRRSYVGTETVEGCQHSAVLANQPARIPLCHEEKPVRLNHAIRVSSACPRTARFAAVADEGLAKCGGRQHSAEVYRLRRKRAAPRACRVFDDRQRSSAATAA